ncbi:YihY/virulence factor BrkB family protein [Chryseolinea lacunae]|uniref:YihY/virulence factor BrkB family protein n=1 Tax=Chryseolinea lacunae TaxID=2801331 RepID=A0ABS1L084_9BACT|nr:YihY/virulence factor BrkB family protein [Chryseolinea lacunae]MBL0745104.1 YihY/virulence factor BrkB family protein [Chryseolinea lacunae]
MKKFLTSSWSILKKTVLNFIEDDSFSYASSIAFYTIFSLPAILIISLSVGSAFFEHDVVQQELVNQVSRLIGRESAQEVEKILMNAAIDASSVFAKTVGVVTLVFSATTVFISLQASLNKIWGIKPKPLRGLVKFVLNRLLSLAMVMSIGFVLLVSLVVDTVLVVFQGFLSQILAGMTLYVLTAINIVVSLGFITLIFGLMFKVLPDAKIKWRDVWVGSFVTTVLFTIGKYLIGLYLGNSSFNSAYGAAGSLVIILVWVYYSTVIFLFGAELTSVYAEEIGSEITPYENAVKVQMVELEKDEKHGETVVVSNNHARHSENLEIVPHTAPETLQGDGPKLTVRPADKGQ